MNPPNDLPPQMGKWLASRDPVLLAKAEAVLREAEPHTNNLLWAQAQKENKRALWILLATFLVSQQTAVFSVGSGGMEHPIRTLWQFLVFVPLFLVLHQVLVRPAFWRYFAVVLCLARRGDFRTVPHLLEPWAVVEKAQRREGDKMLVALLWSARPGEIAFSSKPNRHNPAAPLRNRFAALIREGMGRNPDTFAPKQAETRRQVRLWLALLPHFAMHADEQSRETLRRVAYAHPRNANEGQIQQAARALSEPADELPSAYAEPQAAPTTAPVWSDTPAQTQRLRRW